MYEVWISNSLSHPVSRLIDDPWNEVSLNDLFICCCCCWFFFFFHVLFPWLSSFFFFFLTLSTYFWCAWECTSSINNAEGDLCPCTKSILYLFCWWNVITFAVCRRKACRGKIIDSWVGKKVGVCAWLQMFHSVCWLTQKL